MNTVQVLSTSVSPIVLVSACGLITLAMYNRLGAVLGRIRLFHQQKRELLDDLNEHNLEEQQLLLEMLNSQIRGVTHNARAIRMGLFCLLAAAATFLLCSPFAAAAVVREWFGFVAMGLQLLGVTLFICGIAWSIRDLTLSLAPLDEENAYLDAVTARLLAKARLGKRRAKMKTA